MSDHEKLIIASKKLGVLIKKSELPVNDFAKKWHALAQTSTQKRNALARQNASARGALWL